MICNEFQLFDCFYSLLMYFQYFVDWKLRNVPEQTTLQGCTQSYIMMNIHIKGTENICDITISNQLRNT